MGSGWARMDSNHRPPTYKVGTLTAELRAHIQILAKRGPKVELFGQPLLRPLLYSGRI